jgi:hypothetical protein
MAAKDALNRDLFHGTGGEIAGGIVKPSDDGALGSGAYATTGLDTARSHARVKAGQQGRLFGTVYKVRPIMNKPTVRDVGSNEQYVVDTKGLQVEEAVDFPLNISAMHKRIWRGE